MTTNRDGSEIESTTHAPEGSVFAWPEFTLTSTFEPCGPDDLPVYYFYPRYASDEQLERQWIVVRERDVVDIADVR